VTLPPDTLLGISLAAFLAGERKFVVIFEPGERALQNFFWAGGRLVVPAAGGHGYGKDNKEQAAFTALGYTFLSRAIGWSFGALGEGFFLAAERSVPTSQRSVSDDLPENALVAKLNAARKHKKRAPGKGGGRRSIAEATPELALLFPSLAQHCVTSRACHWTLRTGIGDPRP
jgi:hypothetical protein